MASKNTIARTDDGTVQVTFTIPASDVAAKEEQVLVEAAKTSKIHGFRPGKAPLDKVREKVSQDEITQRSLSLILPKIYSDAIAEHKLRPAIYPKFEVISQGDDTWQVRATLCELPEVDLNSYKQAVGGALRSTSLKKALTKEEKEQKILQTLLEVVKVKIPKILIEEEVNKRLSDLLARIEKLGLTLEGYLASVGKNPEGLRQEYEKQISEGITLELALNKVADEEKLEAKEEEVEKLLKTTNAPDSPEQKVIVKSVLRRRAALDHLIARM